MNNLLQHLKDLRDPMMEEILTDTEQRLSQGRTDLPLSLCFAVDRGDDLLLQQSLRRGSDPSELDNNSTASKGSKHCVVPILDYGADPNIRDSEGSDPVWEAVLRKHESAVKILVENGASISCGDVGHFASIAMEQNNLNLLKDIVSFGGDVTQPNINETTLLHTAIDGGNVEIVKFLIDEGADIDKPDSHGLTPRALADHQGFEKIQVLFKLRMLTRDHQFSLVQCSSRGCHFLGSILLSITVRLNTSIFL